MMSTITYIYWQESSK